MLVYRLTITTKHKHADHLHTKGTIQWPIRKHVMEELVTTEIRSIEGHIIKLKAKLSRQRQESTTCRCRRWIWTIGVVIRIVDMVLIQFQQTCHCSVPWCSVQHIKLVTVYHFCEAGRFGADHVCLATELLGRASSC